MDAVSKVKMIDALQSWSSGKEVAINEGVAQNSFINFPFNNYSTSSMTCTINVPSRYVGMERQVLYEVAGTCVVNGTAPKGSTLWKADGTACRFALSENAWDQVVQTEQVQVGSKQNTCQRSTLGVELARLGDSTKADTLWGSGIPSRKDDESRFLPWIGTTNRTPFANLYDINFSDSVVNPRTTNLKITAQSAAAANNGDPVSSTIAFHFYAFSRVSPFSATEYALPSLLGLDLVTFTINFDNLARLLSVYAPTGYTITSIGTFNWENHPEGYKTQMLARFCTPSAYSFKASDPASYIYDYYESQLFQGPVTTMAARTLTGVTPVQFNLQQISGNVIPKRLLIGCRDVRSNLTLAGATRPIQYYPVAATNAINLYLNNSTILNGVNQRQLYNLSLAAGLSQCTYEQFVGQDVTLDGITAPTDADNYVLGGSFLVIDPEACGNISALGLTSGTKAFWSLSGSVNFYNNTYTQTTNAQLFVIAIYEGYMTINNGTCDASIGLFSRDEVVRSFDSEETAVSNALYTLTNREKNLGYEGGSVLSKLKHALSYVGKHASVVGKVAKAVGDEERRLARRK